MTRVAIIIVNYRSAALTLECLASLVCDGFSRAHARVIVVDNASDDDSVRQLRAGIAADAWEAWVTLIESPDNRGFAAGNNAAICRVLHRDDAPQYLLLLNPDTRVTVGAVATLVRHLDQHPRVGIVGSGLVDAAGAVQPAAHRFPSALGELEMAARRAIISRLLQRWRVTPTPGPNAAACDWVSGAALMIRSSVVRQIGLLDEGFFLYFEEVDWCRRAKSAGWQIWHEPAASVMHLEGASTGIRQALPQGPHWQASRRRYFQKHHGIAGLWAADIGRAAGRAGHAISEPFRPGRALAPAGPDKRVTDHDPSFNT